MKAQIGQGGNVVITTPKRVVQFQADSHEETKAWFRVLALVTSKDISPFIALKDELGTGAFGSVHQGIVENSGKSPTAPEEVYAVKVIKKSKTDRRLIPRLRREIDIQQRLLHDSIVRLVDAFETKADIYIVMELVKGGMLVDRLISMHKFRESDAQYVMQQLLEAVNYLHGCGVVHRDLKLDNILCTYEKGLKVKIADFGLAGRLTHDAEGRCSVSREENGDVRHLKSYVGTPLYMAPEITGDSEYDEAVDLWSLGIVMYALISGEIPDFDPDDEHTQPGTVAGPDSPVWKTVSPDAWSLVHGLLSRDPLKRLNAQAALEHDWFKRSSELSDKPLDVDLVSLREQEKNLRKYVHLVLAMNKFKSLALERTAGKEKKVVGDKHFESIDE
eukprot:CAMPEP_0113963666 /NCGR_PEP_ID=MMETSP0011_2-20120614/6652_1 /TAXON_ID=101924 /ORGANISM="Rhodosorus marinus" /LENGTH=388 /DNA_ID=CAMNT_0000975765 /DNA_START=668 /DNA_END=1834 /DNA_ORIENTATION=- /assembly_acc=CAM_ASM_000156